MVNRVHWRIEYRVPAGWAACCTYDKRSTARLELESHQTSREPARRERTYRIVRLPAHTG